MSKNRFGKKISDTADLILSHLNGEITQEGKEKLERWLSENKENGELLKSLEQNVNSQNDIEFFSSIDVQNSLKRIKVLTGQTPAPLFKRYSTFIKAACLVILISGAVGFYQTLKQNNTTIAVIRPVPAKNADLTIKPGSNKAQLELANGTTVVLEEYNGSVIHDQGIRIDRQHGVIYYSVSNDVSTDEMNYNRISTPKGGKYEIVLPDGSHVWLNSESSVRFPISQSQKERVVELTGEAYFEVAKMPDRPFKVHVNDVTVEALGTSFNIRSYKNESTKTTLVEGSIKVSKGSQSKLVVPGQQVEAKEALRLVDDSNILQAIAWKADLFEFENDELRTIFPQLERWYNVEIDCSPKISIKRFTGTISRNTDIMVILEMLKEAGINYEIKERRIFLF